MNLGTSQKIAVLVCSMLVGMTTMLQLANAAPSANTTYRNLQSAQSKVTRSFTSGSIISASSSGNSARRWYIFNEGSVGGSYTTIGQANYWAVDLGYHAYLRTIESTVLGLNFLIGAELNFPIYLSVNGRSNILADHRTFETEEAEGIKGWGIELPAMIGFEKNGFYIVGLVGYSWLLMKDTYTKVSGRGAHPTVQTQYDGLIYGAGLGYKVSNVINIGFRWTMGNMTNRKEQTTFDQSAINDSLDTTDNSITVARGRDIYNIDFQKFMVFVGIVF